LWVRVPPIATDIENRLVSVTANGQTTTMTYDGDGGSFILA